MGLHFIGIDAKGELINLDKVKFINKKKYKGKKNLRILHGNNIANKI